MAPLRAHNRADGAAGHLKVAETKAVRSGFMIHELSEWAFAASRLKNTLMIQADAHAFTGKETETKD